MRRRALLRAKPRGHSKEYDLPSYPTDYVGWITDVLIAVDFQWTPAQILATDDLYPGLIDDIVTELAFRKDVKDELNGE